MHKRDITYEDFDGNEITETFYFNLNKAEVMEIQAKYQHGTFGREMETAIETEDFPTIYAEVTEVVQKAFGEKSADGKSFMKSPERRAWFVGTNAYAELIALMGSDEKETQKFIQETLPAGFVDAEVQDKPKTPPAKEIVVQPPTPPVAPAPEPNQE